MTTRMQLYAASQRYFGGCFDISHHNGLIKWSRIPSSYRLVFIKATQGTKFVDPLFLTYHDGARDTNRLVVPYHFINDEPSDVQARHFLHTAGALHNAPLMIDWEENLQHQIPSAVIVEGLIKAIKASTGRLPLVYHGIYTHASTHINECPWHVPKYGPEPGVKWLFWQDSPKAAIPGVSSPTDHDYFNGTVEELEAWHATGALPSVLRSAI